MNSTTRVSFRVRIERTVFIKAFSAHQRSETLAPSWLGCTACRKYFLPWTIPMAANPLQFPATGTSAWQMIQLRADSSSRSLISSNSVLEPKCFYSFMLCVQRGVRRPPALPPARPQNTPNPSAVKSDVLIRNPISVSLLQWLAKALFSYSSLWFLLNSSMWSPMVGSPL